jgi:hypothetical protein
MPTQTEVIRTPPSYCQYADGPCDQTFNRLNVEGVFLYPSDPAPMASAIEGAAALLSQSNPPGVWLTWREFRTTGQVIFCSICRHIRFSSVIVADVTTLNFNLMFEIGFALGLELPLILIRDTSFKRDERDFRDLGILENIGYLDFANSDGLARSIRTSLPVNAIPLPPVDLNRDMPLYFVKSPVSTEGQMRLASVIERSPLKSRSYDPVEDPPLSLHDARKQVASSFGLIGHLLMPERSGAVVHNARTALLAGMATASGKVVVLFNEGNAAQPIDYRDLVIPYANPHQIDGKLEIPIRRILDRLLNSSVVSVRPPQRLLERLDLGDNAAENEINQLREYFVPTGQYNEAKRGHARLIVGRKGAGKTAIFYAVRDSLPTTHSYLVLDMKPEGHQFTKLREAVLARLTKGLQEHTLTAFWTYILLCELLQKIMERDQSWAQRDEERHNKFSELKVLAEELVPHDTGDFSERLLQQVDRMASRFDELGEVGPSRITELLFRTEIPRLETVLGDYLAYKQEVWMLIDNLDKGWPTCGATPEDILIIRTLLDATRKLQRQLDRRGVSMFSLVFLRNDIYDLLVRNTSDRDKDTAIIVDWQDPEVFKEVVGRRIKAATRLEGSFDEVWSAAFEQSVGTQDSFRYVTERTLMRPRDLIRFLRKSVEIAVNRHHDRVRSEDLIAAESIYSEELLKSINYEIGDLSSQYIDLLYHFIGCDTVMALAEATRLISTAVGADHATEALQLLIWFGFLGVLLNDGEEPQYAYDIRYNVEKINVLLNTGRGQLVVHPAFRTSLGCRSSHGGTRALST